jgi:hypothetical protein
VSTIGAFITGAFTGRSAALAWPMAAASSAPANSIFRIVTPQGLRPHSVLLE